MKKHSTKRQRPKIKHKVDNHPKLIKRWKSWLPAMKHDIADLLGKRETFWELQEVAKENPKIMNPHSFFDWMCRNYIVSQAVGVRSHVDQSRDSRSLWRMLYEMLENPEAIDRETHVQMYVKTPIGPELGHMTFNSVVGKGRSHLGPQAIRADLRTIEDASERIRRFVNKRVAHKTHPGEIRRLPKFDELDAALDKIDEIFCKYNLLLTGEGYSTQHAIKQFDWREVLWEAWIPKGSKLHPES
jgi:hypothetical protein